MDFATFGTCLLGNQLHANDLASYVFHLLQVFSQLYAAPFSPPTGVNLRFDNVPASAGFFCQALCGGYGFIGRIGHDSFLNAYAVAFKNFFTLILVNVHRGQFNGDDGVVFSARK
jgi:hypothetical protein